MKDCRIYTITCRIYTRRHSKNDSNFVLLKSDLLFLVA